ncbi:hypothetical protein BJ546DRAFT_1076354 [Cryomyces antarcticus]|uniref:Oleosin n=2 Tax=Cryomyces TaxID=329878 RepID=A0ABR0LXQ0_9PEZI|nr:hypothetical protein LTR60_005161 [Cryomyces antarcticus]KAK5017248.1 hypothetical protein LTR39_001652 [Cryomyces antarcticus]KAK5139135.1 hypothetical protein LTR04_003860 [Oleoguttula sp. CCFEE 6159]KAK5256230.1 hypothetical protein LTR16_003736 [Cryomyces antarcticus]
MSELLSTVSGLGGSLMGKGQNMIDSLFPPEKRAEVLARLKSFAITNPKLSAFLLTNFALTGFPLVMFVVFTLTVFVFCLVAALLVGVLAALLFTAFAVGVALLVILPTVFLTTMAASFIFLWGLGGYYIVKWFNKGDGAAADGGAIGDKLNSLTGGRLNFLMDGVKSQSGAASVKSEKPSATSANHTNNTNSNEKSAAAKHEKAAPETNGTPKSGGGVGAHAKKVGDVAKQADLNKVTKTANLDGVTGKAGNATGQLQNTVGSAKGYVGGATGLL